MIKIKNIFNFNQNGNEQLTIIEPTNGFNINRKTNKSEAVLMHLT